MFGGGLGQKRPLVPWPATVGGVAQEDRAARSFAAAAAEPEPWWQCSSEPAGRPGSWRPHSVQREAEPGLLLQKGG